MPIEQPVHHQPQRIKIYIITAPALAIPHLRRHVHLGPLLRQSALGPLHLTRNAEVAELEVPVHIDKNIRWFDISVDNPALLTADQGFADIASQFHYLFLGHFPSLPVLIQIAQQLHPDKCLPADPVLPFPHIEFFNVHYISGGFQDLHHFDLIHQPPSYGFIIIADRLAGVPICQHLPHFALFPWDTDHLDSAVKDLSQLFPLCLIYLSECSAADQFHCMPFRPYLINSVHLYHSFPINKSRAIRLSITKQNGILPRATAYIRSLHFHQIALHAFIIA